MRKREREKKRKEKKWKFPIKLTLFENNKAINRANGYCYRLQRRNRKKKILSVLN